MTRASPDSSRIFRWIAPAFACAGVFHAAAFVQPSIAEPMPRWFHALFVVINAALTVGVVRRPRGFVVLFAIYTAQQIVEHGVRGTRIWHEEHRLDWASVVSVLFVPIVLALLVRDARARSRAITEYGAPR